uniref:Nucleolar protein interacting with the FHA domain of MKI67 n=1 Tax=Salmo trutta TaxID=8032 RepID=A0A674BBF4_SALTR
MRETKAPAAIKLAKALFALNLKEEPEFKTKVQEMKKRPNKGQQISPRVFYVGHLPTELFEPELKSYIEQFGKVVRLQLTRSKTVKKKLGIHYLENVNRWSSTDCHQIVAETMNNYLMGETLIKCHLVPTEVHEKRFMGSQRAFKKPRQPAVEMTGRLLHKEAKLRKRLAEKGINYDFPGFVSKKKLDYTVNASAYVTPVCTPSVLDRMRSMKINDDDSDGEIIKNTPAPKKSIGKWKGEYLVNFSSEEEETEEESFLEGSEKPTTCEEPSGQ